MGEVRSVTIEPKYHKDNGLIVFDIEQGAEIFGFDPVESLMVQLPAGVTGGNHSHLRYEAFIALSAGAELHWIDETGKTHIEEMIVGEETTAFIVPPHVPHAITNTLLRDSIALIEYGSQQQELADVTREIVIPLH